MNSPFAPWRLPPDISAEAHVAAVSTHPRFAEASRHLSANMLALAARDRALDGIVKDIGRFVATGLAMYLHADGGLTLPRLKEVCVRSGISSPGRARAILLYLRFLKYVEPAPAGGGRAGLYLPTQELQQAWSTILRGGFDAAQIVEPRLARLSNRLGDPSVMRALIRIMGEIGLDLANRGSKDNAMWRAFLNRHAGTQILHALMLGADPRDSYPPRGEIVFSLTGLARDFHVSRPHVARLLRAADREGLVTLLGENRLRLTAEGHTQATTLLALRLANDLHAAIALYQEMERGPLRAAG